MAKRQKFDLDDALDAHPVQRQRNGISTLIGSEAATVEPGTETELSLDETDELQRCEQIVERGLKTFFEVGAALMRVRDLRLYRVEYHTFENYCQERWGITRRHANRLVESAEVVHNVGPIGPTPDNEAQARPLAKLKDPEEQRKAWERAVTTAAGRVTAAHVEQVVKEMIGQAAPAAVAPAAAEPEPAPAQQMPAAVPADDDAAALRHENAALRQRLADVQSVLEEYQEYITKAQNYKPTSERGEAVSPFLRLVERVWLEIQETARAKQ